MSKKITLKVTQKWRNNKRKVHPSVSGETRIIRCPLVKDTITVKTEKAAKYLIQEGLCTPIEKPNSDKTVTPDSNSVSSKPAEPTSTGAQTPEPDSVSTQPTQPNSTEEQTAEPNSDSTESAKSNSNGVVNPDELRPQDYELAMKEFIQGSSVETIADKIKYVGQETAAKLKDLETINLQAIQETLTSKQFDSLLKYVAQKQK